MERSTVNKRKTEELGNDILGASSDTYFVLCENNKSVYAYSRSV